MAGKSEDSIKLYQQISSEISKGNIKPVYVLCGEETFFPDRIQEAFVELVPQETRDFNLDILYGRETTLNQALSAARSYPMMAERRVVIVRDFHRYFDPGRDEEESNREDLISYLQQPNPATVLVLIDENKPDGKTRLGQALNKSEQVSVYKFDPVKEEQMPQWIEQWCRETAGKQIDPRASQLLAFHVGNNLMTLVAEIEKLSTYTREDTIQEADVKEVVGISREVNIFDLSDALSAGDRAKVMGLADQMLQTADNPTGEIFKTIGYLTMYFNNLWQMHRLAQKGVADNEIPKQIGMNPYFYRNLKPALRVYPLQKIPHIFEALLDADRALKGFSTMEPEDIYMMTLKRIMT